MNALAPPAPIFAPIDTLMHATRASFHVRGALTGAQATPPHVHADSESEDDTGPDNACAARQARSDPRTLFCRTSPDGTESYHAVWNSVLFRDTPGTAALGHTQEFSGKRQLVAELHAAARQHSRWAVVMSSGGHFAAAVFRLQPEKRVGNEWAEVVLHKTFHRCALSRTRQCRLCATRQLGDACVVGLGADLGVLPTSKRCQRRSRWAFAVRHAFTEGLPRHACMHACLHADT
jgi:hypothetical protein